MSIVNAHHSEVGAISLKTVLGHRSCASQPRNLHSKCFNNNSAALISHFKIKCYVYYCIPKGVHDGGIWLPRSGGHGAVLCGASRALSAPPKGPAEPFVLLP